jgi:hypothetical protein
MDLKEMDKCCKYSIDYETAIEESKCSSYGTGECDNNCDACINEMCKRMEKFGLI